MKKWIMLVALAATMGASGYYGYTTLEKDNRYSDLELANAEALANEEYENIKCNKEIDVTCYFLNNKPQKGERYYN